MAQEPLPHRLTLAERKKLTVTGVTEVISFEDTQVILQTGMGTLSVQGSQLPLEGGQVEVEGSVSALIYEEARQGGWFSRLFG